MTYFLLTLTAFTAFWLETPRQNPPKKNGKKSMALIQNQSWIPIEEDELTIEINKAPFSLNFFCQAYNSKKSKFHAVQMAAFTEKAGMAHLTTGIQLEDTDCFASGTGMAPNKSKYYESLFFEADAHHYLFYENETTNRLNLLGKKGKYLKLGFDISQFTINGKTIHISETDLSEFHLAIFIDRNLNDRIDKGELKKLTVRFN